MNKSDTGLGLGLVAALAICCGAKLLIFGLPALALVTGEARLVLAAGVVALALVGVLIWRRRSSGCGIGPCTPEPAASTHRSPGKILGRDPTPEDRQPVAAGSGARRP